MAWRTVYFDPNGGTLHSQSPLYYNTTGFYWATAQNTGTAYRISQITIPTREGYVFSGFWVPSSDGSREVVSRSGYLQFRDPGNSTATAEWHDYYVITLSKGQYGTGGTSNLYYKLDGGGLYLDTALTEPAAAITPPVGGGNFKGYYYNNTPMVDAQGVVLPAAQSLTLTDNATFDASWIGGAIDYFSLASAALVPFESDDGANRPRIVTRTYGKTAGADQSSLTQWINPTVKYMVVADTTLSVTLGKAFPATETAGYDYDNVWTEIMTRTGYMITSVIVDTRLNSFPIVTISAVANEGADAINTFAVSIPIIARARAQNLLGCISGGGELQALTIAALCDPVVIQERFAPCASDVVNGRFEVHGETLAIHGESAPTAAGGFTAAGYPEIRHGVGWTRFDFSVTKEIF